VDVEQGGSRYVCDVYPSLEADCPVGQFGVVAGRLVADVAAYRTVAAADGTSAREWRQGIKHDAAAVMELAPDHGVRVEDEYLYPMLKGADLFRGRTTGSTRWMVVPQRKLADDVTRLEQSAPHLWAYLSSHGAALDRRRSSIYRGRPRFCIFGVGDYTFAPYKVAISGLHKKAEFRVVGPIGGKPVVFDDTCYFLSLDDPADAAMTGAVLQSTASLRLLDSLVFWDAKRPITKKLLQRLDLNTLAGLADPAEVRDLARANATMLSGGWDGSDVLQYP
jgi:hypothetical protein